MTGSLIFDNALVVSLCNSINCKLWLWPWCRWKNWWLSLCSSVCGSTQSIFSIGNFCLFSWCGHVSYNYYQSLEQTPQYSRRRPNCEAGEGTVQVDRHCTGLDVMRSVSPRIVMNMIAARNFSFKSCQDKVCKRWRYCPWSNEPPTPPQDIAQSTMSLYQKPSETEGVDGLLSPTSVLSSVIDETPEAEARDNIVIVVENN